MASSVSAWTTALTPIVAAGVVFGTAAAVTPATPALPGVTAPAVDLTADPIGAWIDFFSHTADSVGGLTEQAFQPVPQTLPDFAFPGALSMLTFALYSPVLGINAGIDSAVSDAILPLFGGDILAPLNVLPYFLDGLVNGLAPNGALPTLVLPLLPSGMLVAMGGGLLADLGRSSPFSTPPTLLAGTISSLGAALKNLIGFTDSGAPNPFAAVEAPTFVDPASLLDSLGVSHLLDSLDPSSLLDSLGVADLVDSLLSVDLFDAFTW